MMQKRSLYSLLLTSFMLVFAFSLSYAQEVTFESDMVLRCQDNVIDVTVDPGQGNSIGAYEIVFELTGDGALTGVTPTPPPGWTPVGPSYPAAGVVRFGAMRLDNTAGYIDASTVVATISLLTDDVCTGTVTIDETSYTILKCDDRCLINAQTQFVTDCATSTLVIPAVNAGIITIENAIPTVAPIANALVHWGTNIVIDVYGDDGDLHSVPDNCETLTYSLISPPAGMTIQKLDNQHAKISWMPSAAQMVAACEYPITVQVDDACPYGPKASVSTGFTIYLWNDEPEITCSDDVEIYWGYTASGWASAVDTVTAPDPGPAPLLYSVISFNGPGLINLNPATGDWTWDTDETVPYLGCFDLCIAVTDGAAIGCDNGTNPNNADTCCIEICVLPTADIVIEKTHDTYQGQFEFVSIFIDWAPTFEMGGFDFLIAYDASALNAMSVTPGQLLVDCGWEYFEYRFGPFGNCGNACPSGLLRIVAIAEYNNGINHPTCFGPPDTDPYELAEIMFLVTNDRTFECQYVPIQFFWIDCGDNAISNVLGDLLYLDRRIYNYDTTYAGGNLIWDEEDDILFPEDARLWPGFMGAPDFCLDAEEGKPMPRRIIDFWFGGIDIVCADSIDMRGDINLNNVPHEVADAVLFTNYFVYGIGVFNINTAGQIAASDVNADGITLSVADLVHLIRVIVGDADPYYKVGAPAKVNYVHADNGLMSVDGAQIGAAFVVAEGDVTPELKADGMEMRYAFDGINTRILVYSFEANSFTGEFLNLEGDVLSIEMATREGNPVNAKLIPSTFSLAQNYPNPFNPTTSIAFSLPVASDYDLTIYNVSGQTIATFSGTEQAGHVVLEWHADDLASGVYFYRLDAGSFSDTKKMVLLK
jgi:hypothetical protein